MIILILCLVTALSFLGTLIFSRYAISSNIIDIPNNRSSHVIQTPRGGGSVFAALIVLTLGILQLKLLAFTSGLVAILGFLDDKYSIKTTSRFLMQLIIAALFSSSFGLSLVWTVIIIFYMTYALNLYNFMDGINGIAGLEALFVGLSMALIFHLNGNLQYTHLMLIISSAVLGFLFLNFPKAQIFMGDVGSSFLGFTFAGLSIISGMQDINILLSWWILLAVFVVDASLTLVTRIINKDQWYQAHCTHAYQHLRAKYKSHVKVSLGISVLNVILLLPLALLVAQAKINPYLGLVGAYLPIIILGVYFGCGRKGNYDQ
jgi:Fuc2NAc and GlcNAc transferase